MRCNGVHPVRGKIDPMIGGSRVNALLDGKIYLIITRTCETCVRYIFLSLSFSLKGNFYLSIL